MVRLTALGKARPLESGRVGGIGRRRRRSRPLHDVNGDVGPLRKP